MCSGRSLPSAAGWRTEVHVDDIDGREDVGTAASGLPAGHVELKRPGLAARAERLTGASRNHWQRLEALPYLVGADGSGWSLRRSGEPGQRATVAGDVSGGGAKGIYPDSPDAVRELPCDFLYWKPVVSGTDECLAGFLAPVAGILRDEVQEALGRESSHPERLATERSSVPGRR